MTRLRRELINPFAGASLLKGSTKSEVTLRREGMPNGKKKITIAELTGGCAMVLHQSMIALQSNLDYPDFDYWDFFSRRLLCRLRVRALLLLLKAKKNSLLVHFSTL